MESDETSSRIEDPWFEFRIEDTNGRGIEIDKLTQVLADLRAAFFAVARAKLGKRGRAGRPTRDEQALASIRILNVKPGSTIIEAEPPVVLDQFQFDTMAQLTADDVAMDLVEEVRRLSTDQPSSFSQGDVRRRVNDLLRTAGSVGDIAEVIHRPKEPSRRILASETRARLATKDLPEEVSTPPTEPRTRRVAGRAYMVDVEPGRYRIRVKLPDGRDLTLEATPELAGLLKQAVDQVVEIESVEEILGGEVASRMAVDLHVLPSSGPGNLKPPLSLEELATDQGIPDEPVDYVELASAIWRTEEDLADFESHLAALRSGST